MATDPYAEFAALVRRQSRFVYKVAYAILRNTHDAEDAVQETFLKLYRNRGWQQAKNERAFLARAAWRVAVDLRPRAERRTDEEIAEDTLPSDAPGPEQMALAGDARARVHALIDALPDELRVPLVLASFEELSSRDIGAALGLPEGTVRTRLLRARQLLRAKLERQPLQEARHG